MSKVMKKIDFFCKSFHMEHAPLQHTVGGMRAEVAASHHFPNEVLAFHR